MIRVFVADDHAVVREGLRAMIAAAPGLALVGEARDGREALLALERLDVDVLVLDLSLPRVAGIEVLRRLRQARPALRVVALSMYPEEQYATRLLRAGAAGYVSKDRPLADVERAIREAASGRVAAPARAAAPGTGRAARVALRAGVSGLPPAPAGPLQRRHRRGAGPRAQHGLEPHRAPETEARRDHPRRGRLLRAPHGARRLMAEVLTTAAEALANALFGGARRPGQLLLLRGGVPFVGCAVPFGRDAPAFLAACRARHGDLFTLHLAGRRMTFALDRRPALLQQQDDLAFTEMAFELSARIFGHPEVTGDTVPEILSITKDHLKGEALADLGARPRAD